jgi:trans-2,3-dihydro-3-hydroxyanthranilate isomerase
MLDEGLIPRDAVAFVLEEKIGPVPIRIEAGEPPLIWLRTPPITYGPTWDRETCAAAVGLRHDDLLDVPPQLVSAGIPFLFIPAKNADVVDRAAPVRMDVVRGDALEPFCVFVFAPTPAGAYSRMFGPDLGVLEDLATGSATGPLASFMTRYGLLNGPRMTSEQGTKMGRRSILHVAIDGDAIEVGGHVAPIANGQFIV